MIKYLALTKYNTVPILAKDLKDARKKAKEIISPFLDDIEILTVDDYFKKNKQSEPLEKFHSFSVLENIPYQGYELMEFSSATECKEAISKIVKGDYEFVICNKILTVEDLGKEGFKFYKAEKKKFEEKLALKKKQYEDRVAKRLKNRKIVL